MQKFGDALTLNPPIHSIFCEGVWHDPDGNDTPVFLPLRGPTDAEVLQIAMDTCRRTLRWLVRKGVVQPGEDFDEDESALAEDDPVRAWCTKAAILDRIAVGKNAGQLVARLRDDPVQPKKMGRRCAVADGFAVRGGRWLQRACKRAHRPAGQGPSRKTVSLHPEAGPVQRPPGAPARRPHPRSPQTTLVGRYMGETV